MRLLLPALLLVAALNACERKAPPPDAGAPRSRPPCSDPGYGPGPTLAPVAGSVPFDVFQNCLWPEHARIAVGVRVAVRPSRAQVERLLRGLWEQAQRGLGKDFPRVAQVCVFEGPGGWSPDFLGCLNRGFEPAAEDDEGGDGGEELPELVNRAPFSPSEEGVRIQALVGGSATFDASRGAIAVEVPCAARCPDALAGFFRAAFAFYPAVTEVKALDYRCVRAGKALVEVHVPNESAFAATGPWSLREVLGRAGPDASVAQLRAALARLPEGSVRVSPALCGH